MPGWLKALLVVLIVVVLLVIGVVGVGVFWVMKNKDAWMARAKEVATEAEAFGSRTDNQGCVDEGLARYKKDPGLSSVISNSVFMRACLEASRPTSGFCNNVPKQTEFIKTAQWRMNQCRQAGLGSDNKCQNLFTPVQQFCQEKSSQ